MSGYWRSRYDPQTDLDLFLCKKAKWKDNDINGCFVWGLIDISTIIVHTDMKIDYNYTLFFTARDSHGPTFLSLEEHVRE